MKASPQHVWVLEEERKSLAFFPTWKYIFKRWDPRVKLWKWGAKNIYRFHHEMNNHFCTEKKNGWNSTQENSLLSVVITTLQLYSSGMILYIRGVFGRLYFYVGKYSITRVHFLLYGFLYICINWLYCREKINIFSIDCQKQSIGVKWSYSVVSSSLWPHGL